MQRSIQIHSPVKRLRLLFFPKILNDGKPLNIFAKKPILDI